MNCDWFKQNWTHGNKNNYPKQRLWTNQSMVHSRCHRRHNLEQTQCSIDGEALTLWHSYSIKSLNTIQIRRTLVRIGTLFPSPHGAYGGNELLSRQFTCASRIDRILCSELTQRGRCHLVFFQIHFWQKQNMFWRCTYMQSVQVEYRWWLMWGRFKVLFSAMDITNVHENACFLLCNTLLRFIREERKVLHEIVNRHSSWKLNQIENN